MAHAWRIACVPLVVNIPRNNIPHVYMALPTRERGVIHAKKRVAHAQNATRV